MKLGNKIHFLRAKRGMTQGQLAARASLSQGYLSQLEKGDVKNPSASVLFRLARAVHVDPDELFEAAGCTTGRSLRETYRHYESNIEPDLLQYVGQLSRDRQRRLLLLLQGMESLLVKERVPRDRQIREFYRAGISKEGRLDSRGVYVSRGG